MLMVISPRFLSTPSKKIAPVCKIKDKSCKNHLYLFTRPFLVHNLHAKVFYRSCSNTGLQLKNPSNRKVSLLFFINSCPLRFDKSYPPRLDIIPGFLETPVPSFSKFENKNKFPSHHILFAHTQMGYIPRISHKLSNLPL